jgi:hypothetical protein
VRNGFPPDCAKIKGNHKMIRTLIALPILLVLLAAGALYASYGEIDPCRALAVERSRRAEDDTGIRIGGLVEPWMRFATSQLSTGQCARQLIDSWRDRLSHKDED